MIELLRFTGTDTRGQSIDLDEVPAALETTAEQIIAQNLIPALTSSVVPEWYRSLMPIVEPRLDGHGHDGHDEVRAFERLGRGGGGDPRPIADRREQAVDRYGGYRGGRGCGR